MNTYSEIEVGTITGDACVSLSQALSRIKTSDSKNARNILAQKGVLVRLSFAKVFHLFNVSHELSL